MSWQIMITSAMITIAMMIAYLNFDAMGGYTHSFPHGEKKTYRIGFQTINSLFAGDTCDFFKRYNHVFVIPVLLKDT